MYRKHWRWRKLRQPTTTFMIWSLATQGCGHITPVLRELHWLLIWEHVKFKVACLVCQLLWGRRVYLGTTSVSCPTGLGALRGQLTFWLVWCCKHCINGDRTFAAMAPRLWNCLPIQLHNRDISYKWQLKGHLIQEAWTCWKNIFLDVIFDRKLSFIPRKKHLKEKCTKALNLLRIVSHPTWRADQQTLLHLYRSLIRSKLDYGCVVYGTAIYFVLCGFCSQSTVFLTLKEFWKLVRFWQSYRR